MSVAVAYPKVSDTVKMRSALLSSDFSPSPLLYVMCTKPCSDKMALDAYSITNVMNVGIGLVASLESNHTCVMARGTRNSSMHQSPARVIRVADIRRDPLPNRNMSPSIDRVNPSVSRKCRGRKVYVAAALDMLKNGRMISKAAPSKLAHGEALLVVRKGTSVSRERVVDILCVPGRPKVTWFVKKKNNKNLENWYG